MKRFPFFLASGLLLAASIFAIHSCQKEAQPAVSSNITAEQRAAIEARGLKSAGAFVDQHGNIIVEGDLLFSLAEPAGDSHSQAEDRQRVAGGNCVRGYIQTGEPIQFYISNDFDDAWKASIREGVSAWETPENNCAFIEVNTAAMAAIVFNRNDNLGSNRYGVADLPCNNHGRNIYLNVYETEADHGTTPLSDCVRNLSTHEFGHALGFHHTDSAAELLSGTPASDPFSIMLSGPAWPPAPAGLPWFGALPGPDANDFKMAAYLFPRDGAHVELGVIQSAMDETGNYRIKVQFAQVTALCYQLEYVLSKGGVVMETGTFYSNGQMLDGFDILNAYPRGSYTLTLCGKNYQQDYNANCDLISTKTFALPLPACCPTNG